MCLVIFDYVLAINFETILGVIFFREDFYLLLLGYGIVAANSNVIFPELQLFKP